MSSAEALIVTSSTSRRRYFWIALGCLILATAAFVDIAILEPRIHVRWASDLTASAREALERRYQLTSGTLVEGSTWRYEPRDRSPENVQALINDPAVEDTAYIDRSTLRVPGHEVRVGFSRLRYLVGSSPAQLGQPQSFLLFVAGAAMLWAARARAMLLRRATAIAVLAVVTVAAYAVPLRQPIRMGDSDTYLRSRAAFEEYSGVRQLRFEAHLSHAALGRLDRLFGSTDASPALAFDWLMRGATAWFIASALIIGVLEAWSPQVLRYLGLVLLAPSTLLFFGYRELGHLSLNLAVFPLVARGLAEGSRRLEAGGLFAGFAAAWHGFGLLSVAGSGLAALSHRVPWSNRLRFALSVGVCALAAYLVWLAVYAVVLSLPLVAGHASSIPLRPWFTDEVGERVNAAIFSRFGLRDVLFSAWVVGVPLVIVAARMWRRHPEVARLALWYAVPSCVFLLMFWPIQGLGMEMDLVCAAFPAVFALAWVCAAEERSTLVAAALLASAQVAFWRIVIGIDFINSTIS